ncbi:MAG: SIR2 family protein [Nitrospirota bacterium]
MNKQKYSSSDVIFLLGAGASVDAGMPTVKELTHCIREQLLYMKDINGNQTDAFSTIFTAIADVDQEAGNNYEIFFDYIRLITTVTKTPRNKLFDVNLSGEQLEKVWHLPYIIGNLVKDILNKYQRSSAPDYLSRIADLIPEQGQLKVFTLNYDLCMENACRMKGIFLTTGFDDTWQPGLFNIPQNGISLYKLHGSLRWFTDEQWNILELAEIPKDKTPELVLGPGSKIQADDPFLTLFYEFSRATQKAKACIVIGYGYQDTHINTVLERSKIKNIIDVNVKHADILNKINKKPILITGAAKDVLEKGEIKKKLEETL